MAEALILEEVVAAVEEALEEEAVGVLDIPEINPISATNTRLKTKLL